MWVGKLEELDKCSILSERERRLVVEFIKNNDMRLLSNGMYELDANNYVNIFEYDTKENDGVFEAHKKYIDIHYTIVGEEKILWSDKYAEETKPYQVDGDYSLGTTNNAQEVQLNGTICLFDIDEPHKAGVLASNSSYVKKAVFKMQIKGGR